MQKSNTIYYSYVSLWVSISAVFDRSVWIYEITVISKGKVWSSVARLGKGARIIMEFVVKSQTIFGYMKLCVRWIARMLTDKTYKMKFAHAFLERKQKIILNTVWYGVYWYTLASSYLHHNPCHYNRAT